MKNDKPIQKRTAMLGALGAAAALALSGCAGDPAATSETGSEGPLARMAVAVAPAADTMGPFLAADLGYFAELGLDVDVQAVGAGGAALVPALESDSIQVGSSNLLSNLQGVERGINLKCIAGAFKASSSAQLILAPKDRESIKSGKDLEGKTVGINTIGNINQLIVSRWVEEHGGDATKVQFVAIGFPDQAASLQNGQISAAITNEPFTSQMIDAGYPVLDDFPAGVIAEKPTFSCWTASGSWAASHPREVAAFQKALSRVDEYLTSNPDAVRKTVVTHLKVSQEVADSMLLPSISTKMSIDDINAWKEPGRKYGFLKTDVDSNQLVGFTQ